MKLSLRLPVLVAVFTAVLSMGAASAARAEQRLVHAERSLYREVLVYDNGASRPGRLEVSRVARFRRVDDHTAQLVWQWGEGGWSEPNFGSAVTMPDGHVFVGTGHCADCGDPGDTAWMLEVDPETDEVVWRYDFTDEQDSLYRAQPIPGCQVFTNRRYCGEAR